MQGFDQDLTSASEREDQSAFVSEQNSLLLYNISLFASQLQQQQGRRVTLYTMSLVDISVSDQVVDFFAIDT